MVRCLFFSLALRLGIDIALTVAGIWFLAHTTSIEDIILNACALEFVPAGFYEVDRCSRVRGASCGGLLRHYAYCSVCESSHVEAPFDPEDQARPTCSVAKEPQYLRIEVLGRYVKQSEIHSV